MLVGLAGVGSGEPVLARLERLAECREVHARAPRELEQAVRLLLLAHGVAHEVGEHLHARIVVASARIQALDRADQVPDLAVLDDGVVVELPV